MPRVVPNVPAETDLLCENCGYILNGLPSNGNCPECGSPVEESTGPDARQPSGWERDRSFFATTAEVIFRPTRFFRNTTTRGEPAATSGFGKVHVAIASALFAIAGILHAEILGFDFSARTMVIDVLLWLAVTAATFAALILLTRFAARLTTWEATYRGFRLPLPVVRRALDFHAAHYLPLALLAVATTAGYQIALHVQLMYWSIHWKIYFVVLSTEVILGAAYLFHTYWIAMRKMMYANY